MPKKVTIFQISSDLSYTLKAGSAFQRLLGLPLGVSAFHVLSIKACLLCAMHMIIN